MLWWESLKLRIPVPAIKRRAMSRLARSGREDVAVRMLKDRNRTVREEAARILGMRSYFAGVKALVDALSDDASEVRVAAARALARLGSARQSYRAFSRRDRVGATLRFAEGLSGPSLFTGQFQTAKRAVRPLSNCLRDQDERVREAAATALGELGRFEALDPLEQALEDPADGVRKAAASSLRQLEEFAESVKQDVSELAGDSDDVLRRLVAMALDMIGQPGGAR